MIENNGHSSTTSAIRRCPLYSATPTQTSSASPSIHHAVESRRVVKSRRYRRCWAEHVAHTVEDPRVDGRRILAHRQSQQQHRDYTHGRPPAHRPVDRHIPKVNYTREESTTDAVQAATTGRLTVAGPPPKRMTSRIGFAELQRTVSTAERDRFGTKAAPPKQDDGPTYLSALWFSRSRAAHLQGRAPRPLAARG